MSSLDIRAGQMDCITCPPPPPDPGVFWEIVSWTGWGVMLAAMVTLVIALVLGSRHRGCFPDAKQAQAQARLFRISLICVPAMIAGSVVGALVPD